VSDRAMMSTRSLDYDDGRCRRRRRRRCKVVDVSLAILVALALFAQQTSGVGGELAAAADRKSRKRQSAVLDELAPLSSVEEDPYETDSQLQTYSNATSNRRSSADRHNFEFVNPRPGKLHVLLAASTGKTVESKQFQYFVIYMLVKHCIWLNKQQLFLYHKDLPISCL